MNETRPVSIEWPRGLEQVLLLCCSLLLLLWHHRMFTFDTWWHLAMGWDIVRLRTIPPELYSYTARGADLHFHSWLCDVVFASVASSLSLSNLELFGVLISFAAACLAASNARLLGARGFWPLAAGMAFLLSAKTLLILRPQIVSLCLLGAIFRIVQISLRGDMRPAFALPFLFALWSNVHGVYVFGLLLLAVFAGFAFLFPQVPEHRARACRLAGWLALSGLASGLNPLGFSQLLSVFEHDPFVLGASAHIDEWLPPSLQRTPEFYAIVVLGLLATIKGKCRPSLLELSVFILTLCMALLSWRHIAIFAVFGLPVLAAWCSRAEPRLLSGWDLTARQRHWLLGISLICAALISLWQVTLRGPVLNSPSLRRIYPVAAAEWLSSHRPKGNLFNPYEWGGFLIYRLRGDPPVYIDSRLVPYREIFTSEYFKILNLKEGWQEILKERGIQSMLLHADYPHLSKLTDEFGWQIRYRDDTAVVIESSD